MTYLSVLLLRLECNYLPFPFSPLPRFALQFADTHFLRRIQFFIFEKVLVDSTDLAAVVVKHGK